MLFTFTFIKVANTQQPLLEFYLRWFTHSHGLRSATSSSSILTKTKENSSAFSMERQHCAPSSRTMSSSANFASNSFTQYSVQCGTASVQPVSGYMINVPAGGDINPCKWKSHIN